MGILVLVSTGNCHLLDATSFVPLLLSSLTLILSPSHSFTLHIRSHSLAHFHLSLSFSISLASNLCDLSFFLFQTDSLPKRFSRSSNTSKSFFESTSTVESSRLVRDQPILLFSCALSLLQHFLFFFLPTHTPYTSRLLQQLRGKLRDQERRTLLATIFVSSRISINGDIFNEVFNLSEEFENFNAFVWEIYGRCADGNAGYRNITVI